MSNHNFPRLVFQSIRVENEERAEEVKRLQEELTTERTQNAASMKKLEEQLAGVEKKIHKTEVAWRDKEIARLTNEVAKLEAAAAAASESASSATAEQDT
eukprot:SAG31_NODE_951_length_10810_cov_3.083652_8_plen_100_part_00